MAVMLGILAAISLVGGFLLALTDENIVWAVSGIVSFAVLGGFASILTFLKEIRDNQNIIISELKKENTYTEESK